MTHPNREELAGRQRADLDRLLDDDWRVVLQCVARREFEDGIMPGMDDHRRVSECVADTLEAAAAALRQSPSVEEVARVIRRHVTGSTVEFNGRVLPGFGLKGAEKAAQAIAALFGRGG